MFWHTRIYKTGLTVTRNATTKFDLPANTNIGSIFLRIVAQVEVGNPMAALAKWRLIDYIESIDIIADGSTILKSLPSTVLSALCFYDQGGFPPDQEREYSQPYVRNNIFINFGRFWRDAEMYIPAGKYNSLELQIKFTGTSTLYQSDPSMDIIIEQPEGSGVPASKGFMRTEVWREYTSVSDETKYLTLPTQYKIRRFLLQAFPDLDGNEIEETNIFNVLYNVKLTMKSGTIEVYDDGLEFQAKMEAALAGGPMQRHGHIYHTADKGFYTGLGYVISGMVSPASKGGVVATVIPTIEADMNTGTQKMETYTGDEPVPYQVVGLCPDHCVQWKFDDDPDPATWLDPKVDGDVSLELHTRSGAAYADGTVRVILDRLVPA